MLSSRLMIRINLSKPSCPKGARLISVGACQTVIVDASWYDRLSKFKWNLVGRTREYASTTLPMINRVPGKRIYMHRMIAGAVEGEYVDHIDRNKRDNRSSNLRLCTASENQHNQTKHANNKSGYKGVYWCKRSSRWIAAITVNGRRKTIGQFRDPAIAAKAYDAACIKYHAPGYALPNDL